jgi:uncharacterized membrane protein HdeD (DUF308 family)
MRIAIVNMDSLVANWSAILFRGLAALAFGLVTLIAPGLSLIALVLAFGAYAFVDGVFTIISGLRRRGTTDPLWLVMLQGLAGIAAGVITLLRPGISALALLYVVAAWALVTGTLEVVTAIRLRKSIKGEWLLILSGILSVALGVVIALFPGPGALALAIWIGAYAFVSGALLVTLAIRLRTRAKKHEPMMTSPPRGTVTSP